MRRREIDQRVTAANVVWSILAKPNIQSTPTGRIHPTTRVKLTYAALALGVLDLANQFLVSSIDDHLSAPQQKERKVTTALPLF